MRTLQADTTDITVAAVLDRLNEWAPFAEAEEWDNAGLLAGSPDFPVTKIVTALDLSPSVIGQAVKIGAELIVSHHPVIFRPLKHLAGDGPLYQLARHGMAAIAVHTNMDKARGGVNDLLAERLGLQNVRIAQDGLVRIGNLGSETQPRDFAEMAGRLLGVPKGGIQWAGGGRPVRGVAVCGGAGGDFLKDLPPQADAFLTGELHYHEWPFDPARTIVAAGHYHTEAMIADELAKRLSAAFPALTVKAAKEQCPYYNL